MPNCNCQKKESLWQMFKFCSVKHFLILYRLLVRIKLRIYYINLGLKRKRWGTCMNIISDYKFHTIPSQKNVLRNLPFTFLFQSLQQEVRDMTQWYTLCHVNMTTCMQIYTLGKCQAGAAALCLPRLQKAEAKSPQNKGELDNKQGLSLPEMPCLSQ